MKKNQENRPAAAEETKEAAVSSAVSETSDAPKKPKKKKSSLAKKLNSRRFKHGTMATVMTIVMVAVVVLLNVIVSLVQDRLPTVDLTSDNIYQLTDDSIDYLKEMDQEVSITVCATEEDLAASTYGKQITEIINDYAKYNSKIKVEYIDLLKNPEISTEYSDYGVTTYSIIVESDKRIKVASVNDCIESSTDQSTYQTTYQSVAEQVMTSAIMYVTEDSVMKAAVLTGHTEDGCDGMTDILQTNNYEVSELNITTEELSDEYDIACIYAPTTDYTAEELAKLDAFLDNDGEFNKTLIYIAAYDQPELPNLNSFLNEWGISVDSGLLVETNTSNVYDGQGFLFSANYNEDSENLAEYVENLRNAGLPYLTYYCRPLSLTFEESGNRTAELLLTSPSTTVVYPTEDNEDFDINTAEQASHGVVALGYRVKYDGTVKHQSNVLVYGSVGDFASTLIESSNYNNNELSVNMVNTLSGREESVSIVGVSFDAEKLTMTAQSYYAIFVVFVILVPIVTLLIGIVVWMRRRHK